MMYPAQIHLLDGLVGSAVLEFTGLKTVCHASKPDDAAGWETADFPPDLFNVCNTRMRRIP